MNSHCAWFHSLLKLGFRYAFIEFSSREECERAYFKMNNVLIDDHRIKVDFNQSTSKVSFFAPLLVLDLVWIWHDSTGCDQALIAKSSPNYFPAITHSHGSFFCLLGCSQC